MKKLKAQDESENQFRYFVAESCAQMAKVFNEEKLIVNGTPGQPKDWNYSRCGLHLRQQEGHNVCEFLITTIKWI